MLILNYTQLLSIRFMLDVSLQCGKLHDFGDDTLHGRNVGFPSSSHRIIAFFAVLVIISINPYISFLPIFFPDLVTPC